jgi:hypothetical protein
VGETGKALSRERVPERRRPLLADALGIAGCGRLDIAARRGPWLPTLLAQRPRRNARRVVARNPPKRWAPNARG